MNLKKLTGIVTLASVLGFASDASAGVAWDLYAGATIGAGGVTSFASGSKNNTDMAQSYGAMFGVDIPLLRFEAEYSFMNDDKVKMHLGMVNAFFKMPSTVIKPYAGVGVGTIFGGDFGSLDIKTKPAYQGMLGLTVDVPVLPVKFDVEGRVLYSANVIKVSNISPDVLHYDLRLKLRYVF
jgi:hypothetical protein